MHEKFQNNSCRKRSKAWPTFPFSILLTAESYRTNRFSQKYLLVFCFQFWHSSGFPKICRSTSMTVGKFTPRKFSLKKYFIIFQILPSRRFNDSDCSISLIMIFGNLITFTSSILDMDCFLKYYYGHFCVLARDKPTFF